MADPQLALVFPGPAGSVDDDPGSPASAHVARPAATLDQAMIGVVVLREVQRAFALYADWAHPFAGLEFNRARRSFGQAHRDGRIVISRVFIGTTALEDLEDTVRHEIAHLIAGIDERHGPKWRRIAKRLGARPRATGRSSADDLGRRMDDAPYTLLAELESGAVCELKPAYRRSRRYLDYRAGRDGREYRCRGERVTRFIYRPRNGRSA